MNRPHVPISVSFLQLYCPPSFRLQNVFPSSFLTNLTLSFSSSVVPGILHASPVNYQDTERSENHPAEIKNIKYYPSLYISPCGASLVLANISTVFSFAHKLV